MTKKFTPPSTDDLDALLTGVRGRFTETAGDDGAPQDRHDGETASRHDGTTAQRNNGETAQRHDGTPSQRYGVIHQTKFTVLLDPDDGASFDALALDARRRLGRPVRKGELVRALLRLAAARPELLDDLLPHLPHK